jgi:Mor family transcriptional regulator
VFPPVVIGTWPKSEKYGEKGILDGLHRVSAAVVAGLEGLEAIEKNFKTLQEAMLFAYEANMAHGIPVGESARNRRIKLLKQLDAKLTLEELGKQFQLGKSTIDRILKGEHTSEKPGRKTGANGSKGQKSQEAMSPRAFFNMLEKIDFTFQRKRATADIVTAFSPATKDNPDGEPDKEKYDLLATCFNHFKELSKAVS